MSEWIISSSALILMLALIRLLFQKKLSPRVRYALWLAAAVRLLVPVSFFESSVSVLNLVRMAEAGGEGGDSAPAGEDAVAGQEGVSGLGQDDAAGAEGDDAGLSGMGEFLADVGGSDAGLLGVGELWGDGGNGGLSDEMSGGGGLWAVAGGGTGELPGAKEPWAGSERDTSGQPDGVKPWLTPESQESARLAPECSRRFGADPDAAKIKIQSGGMPARGFAPDGAVVPAPDAAAVPAGSSMPSAAVWAKGISALCTGVWLCGVVGFAGLAAAVNMIYRRKIYRSRKYYGVCEESRLPVYVTAAVDSPCMFGLLHPAVYLTPDAAEGKALRHILCHEGTHYRHRDNLWAVVRMMCLCIHWYNPLVWLAARLSKQDCELACDEEAVGRLGEGERIEYGRTLLEFSVQSGAALGSLRLSTTMSGRKRQLRERLLMITRKPKRYAGAMAAVLVLVPLVLAATFTKGSAEGSLTEDGADGAKSAGVPEEVLKNAVGDVSNRVWGNAEGRIPERVLSNMEGNIPETDAGGRESISVPVSYGEDGKYVLNVVSEAVPEGAYHILRIDLCRTDGAGEVLQSIFPGEVKPLYTGEACGADPSGQGLLISYKLDGKCSFAKCLQGYDDIPPDAAAQFLRDDNGPLLSGSPEGGILVADLNFDGYDDFCVQVGVGSENIPYYCYLWNPAQERFAHSAMIPNVGVDREAELVTSSTVDGEGVRSVKYYRFDRERELHLVRYVEEDPSPEALFPAWDLTYCQSRAYMLPAVDNLVSAACYGGGLSERLVRWAKQALTELYEWSGTKITAAYFTATAFGDFYFGNSAQDVDASRTFYSRCYGPRAGFNDCIEEMGVATERVVWYSTVTQWNVPDGMQKMTDAQVVEWYFGRLPMAEGEELESLEKKTDGSYLAKAASGNYYEMYYNEVTREISSVYGPYAEAEICGRAF